MLLINGLLTLRNIFNPQFLSAQVKIVIASADWPVRFSSVHLDGTIQFWLKHK